MEVIVRYKKTLFSASIFLFVLLTFQSSSAQSYQGKYLHIDYVYQSEDRVDDFLQNISEIVKPLQQDRKDQGIIDDWYIYRVEYPGTHDNEYNYVVITVSDQISAFEDIVLGMGDEYSDGNMQRVANEFSNVFTPVISELWTIRNSVMQSDEARPSRYMVMNYMRVGQGFEFEYQMMEDETARPLHQRRMENDVMIGWELNEMILPGGLEYGYNFSTIDYYEQLAHVEFGFTEELIMQENPDTDINEFFENINRSRDLVRREVWELVDHLD
jgi:hypothetical protein